MFEFFLFIFSFCFSFFLSFFLSFFKKELYIYIYWQHFFVDTNFIKYNRYFMSTYFLLDPFEFPYYFHRIRGGIDLCIIHSCMYP